MMGASPRYFWWSFAKQKASTVLIENSAGLVLTIAGRFALGQALGFFVGLHIQQCGDAGADVVVFLASGAEAVADAIEEHAALARIAGLRQHEVAAVLGPVEAWAQRQFAVVDVQADLGFYVLDDDVAAITNLLGAGDNQALGVGQRVILLWHRRLCQVP